MKKKIYTLNKGLLANIISGTKQRNNLLDKDAPAPNPYGPPKKKV